MTAFGTNFHQKSCIFVRLEIGFESDMVKKWLKVCVVEDKIVVIVVALYCSVSRNSIRFKALSCSDCSKRTLDQLNFGR